MNQHRQYLSYLLRLWQEGDAESPLWRASLESPHSESRRVFASLDDLFTYLRERTGMASPAHTTEDFEGTPVADLQACEED